MNTPGSPYKGLAAFGDSALDAMLFFGRERERDLVIANMTASRLTLLYGPTGVGKSSLLNAGVVRTLRDDPETRRVSLVNSWVDDRTDELRAAVADSADGYSYVILDQFEEFFLYHEVAGPFGTELASLLGDRGLRVNVLLSLREDTLAVLDAFKGRIANLYGNSLRLDHLDRESGRAAVLGPLVAFEQVTGEHVEAEPELVEAVLDEVATGRLELVDGARSLGEDGMRDAHIEAPFLQLVLERLWDAEREAGSDTLRLETLAALGGPRRSSVSISTERSPGSARRRRTSPRASSTTSSRPRGRRSPTAPRISPSTRRSTRPSSGPCSRRSGTSGSCGKSRARTAADRATRSSTTCSRTRCLPGGRSAGSSASARRPTASTGACSCSRSRR